MSVWFDRKTDGTVILCASGERDERLLQEFVATYQDSPQRIERIVCAILSGPFLTRVTEEVTPAKLVAIAETISSLINGPKS